MGATRTAAAVAGEQRSFLFLLAAGVSACGVTGLSAGRFRGRGKDNKFDGGGGGERGGGGAAAAASSAADPMPPCSSSALARADAATAEAFPLRVLVIVGKSVSTAWSSPAETRKEREREKKV